MEALSIAEMEDSGGGFDSFDMVDQLHEPTSDGQKDENARMNCVFASYASVVMELKPGVKTNGDFIKDHAYGPGYTGGASGEHVAPFVEREWGVKTDIIHSGDRAYLLRVIKAELDKQHPVIISMPSAWNSQPTKAGYRPNTPNFPTHAGVAFHYTDTELWVMNPWGGFVHKGTLAYWQERLCWGKVYVCSLEGAQTTVTLPYTKLSDGRLQYKNGTLGGGFSSLVLQQKRTADLVFADYYYNEHECCCLFADGAVYHFDARTGTSEDGKAGSVVDGLVAALRVALGKTAPAPAPLSNQQQQDLSVMAALRVALATHA